MESKRKSKMDGVQGSNANQCLNVKEQTEFKNLFEFDEGRDISKPKLFETFQYRKLNEDTPEISNVLVRIKNQLQVL